MHVVCTEEGVYHFRRSFSLPWKAFKSLFVFPFSLLMISKKLCCIAKSSYLTPLCTALYPLGRFTILVGNICEQKALILHPRMSNFGLRRLWTASKHNDHRKFILWQGAKFISWPLGPMMNWKNECLVFQKKVPKFLLKISMACQSCTMTFFFNKSALWCSIMPSQI